jgi:hypothetical protein
VVGAERDGPRGQRSRVDLISRDLADFYAAFAGKIARGGSEDRADSNPELARGRDVGLSNHSLH